MKVEQGMILFLVDTELGKILQRYVLGRIPLGKDFSSVHDRLIIPDFKYVNASEIESVLNPAPENYFTKNYKKVYSKKCYLVFTEKELAQKALIDYVYPLMLEAIQKKADSVRDEYQKLILKTQLIESNIQKEKNKLKKSNGTI